MTTVHVKRNGHGICKLTVCGHAGYAHSGKDIVCAAVSVLITTCANALEKVVGLEPVVDIEEHSAKITVSLPKELSVECQHDAQIVMQTTLQGFQDIAAQYPRYLQII